MGSCKLRFCKKAVLMDGIILHASVPDQTSVHGCQVCVPSERVNTRQGISGHLGPDEAIRYWDAELGYSARQT